MCPMPLSTDKMEDCDDTERLLPLVLRFSFGRTLPDEKDMYMNFSSLKKTKFVENVYVVHEEKEHETFHGGSCENRGNIYLEQL